MKTVLLSTKTDWRWYSFERAIQESKIIYYDSIPFYGTKFSKKLLKLFFSDKLNKKHKIILRKVFFNRIIKSIDCDSNSIIIVYDRSKLSCDEDFLNKLKKKTGAKLVYLFSDIVDKSGAKNNHFAQKLSTIYDDVIAFDKNDAIRYNFKYFGLPYDKIVDEIKLTKFESDLFLIAQAKDRLKDILDVYDLCIKDNLVFECHISNISEEQKELLENKKINIIDGFVPYDFVLERIRKTKCIVDIMQKGSTGITLNICEAILYDKKIITNNKNVLNESFYDPSRFYILGIDVNPIISFLNMEMKIYTKEEKYLFSFDHLLECINSTGV